MIQNPHPTKRRVQLLLGFFAAFLLLFAAVLYDAQVAHGSENRAKSIASNASSETVTASRGIVTDRNGKVLVSNRLAYTLVFDRSGFKKDEDALNAAILRLIDLCRETDTAWSDSLPMTAGSAPPADHRRPLQELQILPGKAEAAGERQRRRAAGGPA